jgi:hypothetical protein
MAQVLDRPVMRENLDLGRPEEVRLIFNPARL